MIPSVLTPRQKIKNQNPQGHSWTIGRVLTMSSPVTDNEYSGTTMKLEDKASVDKRSSTPSKNKHVRLKVEQY